MRGVDVDRDTGESVDATMGGGDGRTARRDPTESLSLTPCWPCSPRTTSNPSPEQVAQRSGVSLRSVRETRQVLDVALQSLLTHNRQASPAA